MNYGIFASYYDLLTRNVNYAGYARRVNTLIKRHCPECNSIAEIACGTASLSFELEKLGYNVIGIDLSAEMLNAAEIKKSETDSGIVLMKQDMRELSLPFRVDAIVCSLDAINHLGGLQDIRKSFLSVRKNLRRGGVFIFDMNTPYKHEHILGDNTFVYEAPEVYTVWQNRFSPDDYTVDMTLDFFIKKNGGYERRTENIREKAYRKTIILSSLKSCGFEPLETFDELTTRATRYDTERILYLARRK